MMPAVRFLRRIWTCGRTATAAATTATQQQQRAAAVPVTIADARMVRRKSVSLDEVRCDYFASRNRDNGYDGDKKHRGRFQPFLIGSAVGVASAAFASQLIGGDDDGDGVVFAASPVNPSGSKGESDVGGGGRKKSRREQFNFIADVVREVGDALVYIEIKDKGRVDIFSGLPATTSNGSGFIVKEDGLILTNAHVIINKPNASVQVRLQDGRTFTGSVEDVDVKSDLATVRIPVKGLPVMPLGESSSVRPGEFVIAMGSPLALSNTVTTGVVSSVHRQRAELGLRNRDVPEYLQTDAAITFGNSGGPLVNLDGEAIGINSMKVTPGISFAIPIDYAKEFLRKSEEARRSGFRPPGSERGGGGSGGDRRYMGITMITITPQILNDLRSRLDLPGNVHHGIVVFRVVRDSPADAVGILPGDIITHINGTEIHGSRDVYKYLESEFDLKMTVVRQHRVFTVLVKPESDH